MPSEKHEYTRDGLTVIWQPAMCIHSAKCVLGLGAVFNPRARPWVNYGRRSGRAHRRK